MKIKSICVKQGMNLGFKIPKKIFDNELLRKDHNRFFGYMDEHDLATKTQELGAMMNRVFDNGVNEENLNIVLYFVNRLMKDENLTSDRVELANVLLSTAIKMIKPEDIKEGRVTPKKLRYLINISIKNYYNHKIGKELDYRHIAGRMLNLKKVSDAFPKVATLYDRKYAPIRWDEEKQADLLGVLERIMVFYDSAKDSFKQTIGFLRSEKANIVSTFDMHQTRFFENIPELMELTCAKVIHLMQEPKKNYDEIKDKLEIAYYYYDKVPYGSHLMPKLIRIFSILRQKEKMLEDIVNPKKRGKKGLYL